jgi:hypothetical protein
LTEHLSAPTSGQRLPAGTLTIIITTIAMVTRMATVVIMGTITPMITTMTTITRMITGTITPTIMIIHTTTRTTTGLAQRAFRCLE